MEVQLAKHDLPRISTAAETEMNFSDEQPEND
jgi:hypothetical protein